MSPRLFLSAGRPVGKSALVHRTRVSAALKVEALGEPVRQRALPKDGLYSGLWQEPRRPPKPKDPTTRMASRIPLCWLPGIPSLLPCLGSKM